MKADRRNDASERRSDAEGTRFAWRMVGVLFGLGATVGALSVIVPHPDSFNEAALWSNIAVGYGAAIFALLAAGRLPAWPIHLFVLLGILTVTRATYYSGDSGDPSGFYAFFYVWVGLYAVFFFSRRVAVAYLAAIGAAYAWLLVELDVDAAIANWVTTIGTVVLAASFIDLLTTRVRRAAGESAALAYERAKLLTALAEVARTDDLTGLPNRRAWDEALERELSRARRDGTPLCVGLVDLDRFKYFNDAHGHQAGDRLLKQLAASWGAELRATDVLARYGGEEFALALPGCDLEDARVLTERLRAATPEGQTCSAGLVLWDGEETSERLFGRADKALYTAKEAGRDRVVAL